MPAMTVGTNLRALRLKAKLTQGQLSAKAGVPQSLISELETGKRQSTSNLPEIAQALGCEIHAIDERYVTSSRIVNDNQSVCDDYTVSIIGNIHIAVDLKRFRSEVYAMLRILRVSPIPAEEMIDDLIEALREISNAQDPRKIEDEDRTADVSSNRALDDPYETASEE